MFTARLQLTSGTAVETLNLEASDTKDFHVHTVIINQTEKATLSAT